MPEYWLGTKYTYLPSVPKHDVESHTIAQNNTLYLFIIVEEDNIRNGFSDYTYSPINPYQMK